MKKLLKEKKAITLIALVITIVVLIILAGVLINISLGNNGLFNKAKTAKEMYTNAQDYEEEQIAKTTNEIDSYVDGNRDVSIINPYTIQTGSTGALSAAGRNEPTFTITLPKEMKDANYMISVNINRWGNGWANIQYRLSDVTTTGFKIIVFNNYDNTANFGFRWSVIGELKEK